MTNEQILKELKAIKDQQNELVLRMEQYLLNKHTENSDAIDEIVISMLGGE